MSNLETVSTPKEVAAFYKKYHCPVCLSDLDEPFSYRDMSFFSAFADCSQEAEHFGVTISWNDPKYIFLSNEEIEFEWENKLYHIKTEYEKEEIYNTIYVSPANTDEVTAVERIKFEYAGKAFDYLNFSLQEIVTRVSTIKVFY